MFVFLLKYIKSLEEVDKVISAHITYLDKFYSLGKFICSGRRLPRIGGVILCKAANIEEAIAITKEDPFLIAGVAEYEIIEFSPTKYKEGFERFISER